MHIHILGVCGTFMGGIAQLATAAGHRVSGCDANVYPPMSLQLQLAGIELIEGYNQNQAKLNPDLYVIGNAISRGNPLLEYILEQNLPFTSGPAWLSDNILKNRWVLGVAGTHGKTTTTSILTWILEYAGLHPGFLIGGVAVNFQCSARLGESPFFVVEADEYDSAFFDKRSKFIHYRPRTTILNNLEFDHADIFADLAAIENQFHHLVRTLPSNGLIVVNQQEQALQRVLQRGAWTPLEYFNATNGLAVSSEADESKLIFHYNGNQIGNCTWQLSGEHNRQNACAAILAARHAGVPFSVSIAALEEFQNVKRRLEHLDNIDGIDIYDDFAHHPTAIATTLAGLRQKISDNSRRIVAIFEPRSNTMKMGNLKDRLPTSLKDADLAFCYTNSLGWDAKAVFANCTCPVYFAEQIDELVELIASKIQPRDCIIIMSNGGFGGLQNKLINKLKIS